MDHVAVAVAGDLDFDMPPALDQFFDDQPGIAEGVFRLAHRGFDFAGQTVQPRHGTHALAAASGRGLQHHRKPEITNDAGDFGGVFACRPAAGDGRDIGRFGFALGRRLVAEPLDGLGGRADEDQPGPLDRARECGILGQKAEAGVNGLRAGALRRRDHGVDPQIAVGRGGAADLGRLADRPDMHGVGVGRGVDPGDGYSQSGDRFAQSGRRFHRDWRSGFS